MRPNVGRCGSRADRLKADKVNVGRWWQGLGRSCLSQKHAEWLAFPEADTNL